MFKEFDNLIKGIISVEEDKYIPMGIKGIRNLQREVLRRAFSDYISYKGSKKSEERRIYEDSFRYFFKKEASDEENPFSLENVCEEMGYDSRFIRRTIDQIGKDMFLEVYQRNGKPCTRRVEMKSRAGYANSL